MSIRVSVLNRKLNALQEQLVAAQQAHTQEILRLEQWYSSEIQRLSREKDEAIARMQQTLLEEDRRIAEEAFRRVEDITRQRLAQLEEENIRYQRVCQELNDQIQQENETLRRRIDDYIHSQECTQQEHQEFAQDLIDMAEQTRQDMDDLPLEKLSGDEYTHYVQLLAQAKDNLRNKLYEAAAAVASNARALMMGLQSRLHTAMAEWNRYFIQWDHLCQQAEGQLTDILNESVPSCLGSHVMPPVEWDYWACGRHTEIRRTLDQHLAIIQQVHSLGVPAYLKQEDSLSADDIRRKISDAYSFPRKIVSLAEKARAESSFSDERYSIGQEILSLMKQECYYIVPGEDPDFPPPDAFTAAQSWYRRFQDSLDPEAPIESYEAETVDSLQFYQLYLTYHGQDRIRIRLVPIRQNDVVVQNLCMLSVELSGAPDPNVLAALQNVNRSRLEGLLRQLPDNRGFSPTAVECVNAAQVKQRTSQLQTGTQTQRPLQPRINGALPGTGAPQSIYT